VTTAELLRQVRLVDPASPGPAPPEPTDVLVVDGQIQAVGPGLAPDSVDIGSSVRVIPGDGRWLLPGLVDLYSHSREPGHEADETLESLLQAAQAGGITRLGVLPTTVPALDQPAQIHHLLHLRHQLGHGPNPLPHLYPWGALTVAAQGERMAELMELAGTPIVGFADGEPLPAPVLLQRLLDYAGPLGKPLALWPCDRALAALGVAREGADALVYGLPAVPATAETAALAALLEQVARQPVPLHLMRLSTARSVDLVAQAKAQGLPVTASTPWLHLLKSSADLATYDPNLRLDPPLGTPDDRDALVVGVATGTLDAVAIDHTPHSYEAKTVGFASAPPGAIGLELALPLLWHHLVDGGLWSPAVLVRALSTAPARIWGQPPPTIAPGHPAEMVLFDPADAWPVTAAELRSRSANTPWWGQTVPGRVQRSWVPALSPVPLSPSSASP